MTTITSQFQQIEREEKVTLSTWAEPREKPPYPTPVRTVSPVGSLAQTSANSGNAPSTNYYLPYLGKPKNSPMIRTYELRDLDETERDYSRKIDVYSLAQPPGHQPTFSTTDPEDRRGKFLSDHQISNSSKNLPRSYKNLEAAILRQKRCQRLRAYLETLRKEAISSREIEFSEKVLDLSWSVWQKLNNWFETRELHLEVPDACPGFRDNFMYTWSKAEHYLECEIFGTGEIEFFYRNRKTGQVWGEDTTIDQGFSTDILHKARLFIE